MKRLWLCLAMVACVGCGASADAEKMGTFTLYSLHGNDKAPNERPKTEESFHSFPVLGKMEIAKAEQRKEILAAIESGLDKGQMAKCFWPRHGLRIEQNGRITDYVICFACEQLSIRDGDSYQLKSTDTTAAALLNKHLKAAGIPQEYQE